MRRPRPQTQRDRALACLSQRGMARLSELKTSGVTAATVSRLEREGIVVRLARGLYQLPDADLDVQHALAEVVKLAPRGVVCLTSALAFHGLTDRMPSDVWIAIGRKDWRPRFERPRARFVHFPAALHEADIAVHVIEGVPVRIYQPARTIADLFRYRRTVGLDLALSGLKEALHQRKVTPSEISRSAIAGRVWKIVEPYLVALTIHD